MKYKLGKGASTDAIALMVIKLVTICLGLILTRLMSQYLSAHDYGTYSQVLLVVSTVSSLTILGMVDGVNFFYCSEENGEKRETYIATLFSLQCIVSTAAGAVVLLLEDVITAGFENPDVAGLLLFAAALPLLQNIVSMMQILLVSVGKARLIALRNLAVSLIKLAAVFAVIMVVQNVRVILITSVLLDIAQIILFLVILRRNGCVVHLSRTDFRLTKQILTYCIPMAVFIMLNSLTRDCDKYLIAMMTDTETLAVYTNASKVLPFDIVMSSFCTVLIPQVTRLISQKEWTSATALYRNFLEIAYISTAILCCAALAAAPQLMELLYSEKYLEGLPVFCVYILVDLIRFTNITLILSAAGKTAKLMVVGAGALMANVVLNAILFRLWGISGPALATLITNVGTGAVMLHLGAKELKSDVRGFFDGKFLCRFAVEAAAALLVFAKLREYLVGFGLNYFVVLVIVGGSCGGLLLLRNGKRLLRNMKCVNGT